MLETQRREREREQKSLKTQQSLLWNPLIIVLTSNMIRKVTERQYFQSHIVKIKHLILTYAGCVNRFHNFTLIKNGK